MTLGNKRHTRKHGMQKKYMTRCLHRWYETAVKIPGNEEPLKITQPVFVLNVEYNIPRSILSLRVQNQCQQLLILREILLFYDTTSRVEFFKGVLRMVPGYEFQYEKGFLFLPNKSYNVVFLSQHPSNEFQLREIASIQFLKPRILRGFDWFQSEICGNKLQQLAIQNIVNRTAYPAPYILFGPPGTGKTCTIVEAVLQIYKLQPHSRILVTATSNYACNELTKRLLKFVPVTDIYRYMAFSSERDINLMDLEILEISNMHMGKYETPSMEDFVMTRILVCTIMNSARLLQLGVKTSMYDYIFIDECGSSKELSALVPIGSVGTDEKNKKLQASVILAGDPKQLGPVTHYTFLKSTEHNVSLLERLMELPYYKKDLNNNEYNTQAVTKLLDNYRSHNSLFKFSNDEFYEGELRAKASAKMTEWVIGWKGLPNPKFPMIFHSIFGTMIQDACSLSYLNCDEAKVVYQYVQDLLKESINGRLVCEQDIGIVTPYSRQVEYIKTGLSNLGLENIEVGSAEQYQGREKSVIIISTVRSNRKTIGFLADQRRLNVVMTRAKALTIIIGNPLNLKKDPTWYKLLKYLAANKAFRGRKCVLGASPTTAPDASMSNLTIADADFS
uniref:Uncharacterized protein n=1 Tax=Anopheles atroparvus TaxID=41427 RepID=A0A182JH76_ANOAO